MKQQYGLCTLNEQQAAWQWWESLRNDTPQQLSQSVLYMQAMFVDFGYAENVGGECILRFDDTNPEAEKQEYIDHINDIVHWMGYKPSKVHRIPSYSICFMSR